jgi:hypothetical protein
VSETSGRKSAPSEPGSTESEAKVSDRVLIHSVSNDGETLGVLRAREDRLEAGVVRKVKEGESIMGELVRLKPRPEFPLLCDVEVEVPSRASGSAPQKLSAGRPAQVATPSYRANWDAIWGKNKKSAPN